MIYKPSFPTILHQDTAELVRDYFLTIPTVDTVLVVNSCARGQAVPESDLDFAILVKPDTTPVEIGIIESAGLNYSTTHQTLLKYKKSNQFAIANKTYPIAYNKWIKYQIADLLNKPDLYPKLSPILSVSNIESNEINDKAKMLRKLLNDLTIEQ